MKTVKALIGLAILVAVIYSLFNVLPHYLTFYQFQDDLKTEAQFGGTGNRSDEDMRENIMKKVAEYNIPVTSEMVKINRVGTRVSISVDYTIVLNLPAGKQIVLDFHPRSD